MPCPACTQALIPLRVWETQSNMVMSKTERSGPASVLADDSLPQARGQQRELPQKFSASSALSFAYIVTNSWVGYSGTFPTALLAGGGPAVFYGIIVAGIVCTIISKLRSSIVCGMLILICYLSPGSCRVGICVPVERRTISFHLYGLVAEISNTLCFCMWLAQYPCLVSDLSVWHHF